MNAQTRIALPTTVADLIEEYLEKVANIDAAIATFGQACTAMDLMTTVQGNYIERVFDRPTLYPDSIRKNLLKSGWRAVYSRLEIDSVATADDKKRFDQALADPPPLTMDNAKATFGDYLLRPRFHILRGLAEVFCSLDQAYKSHSKVKIGVKGLPKRVILNSWDCFHGSYAQNKFRDIANALAALRSQPQIEWAELAEMEADWRAGRDAEFTARELVKVGLGRADQKILTPDRGLTVRKFANGNAHVFFSPDALRDINLALAEFYGEVLPDVEPEDVKPSASTAVSKDLQFYWTPPEVVALALDYVGLPTRNSYSGERPVWRVLEPSCGDGRILDAVRAHGHRGFGIEYHPQRATEARAKGHAVLTANFLEHPPAAEFDAVVMNPPFYGRHYAKHVRHALRFVKPGGVLVAILPATARYDHGELADLVRNERDQWCDLPVASFAEAGTNVPTTMLRIRR